MNNIRTNDNTLALNIFPPNRKCIIDKLFTQIRLFLTIRSPSWAFICGQAAPIPMFALLTVEYEALDSDCAINYTTAEFDKVNIYLNDRLCERNLLYRFRLRFNTQGKTKIIW